MRKRLSECVEWSKDYSGELENNSPVWFVVDRVYAGVYSKDLSIFCMADDKGFNCCDAVCFAPIGASRQLASYPKHGERVAVEIPQLPCIVTGTFNMKYLEEGAIESIPAIELDPIYDFGEVSGAIAWSKVFAWYTIPEIPSYLCYDKTNIVEVPPQECCEEECDEDISINSQKDDIIINDEEDISEIASFNKKKESKMSRTVRRVRENYNYFPADEYSEYPSVDLFENLVIHYIPYRDEDDEDEEYEEDDFSDYDSDFLSVSFTIKGDGKYRFEAHGDFQDAYADDFKTLCEIIEENAYADMDSLTYSDAVLSAESVKAVKENLKEVEESEGLKGLLKESKKNTSSRVRESVADYTIKWSLYDNSKEDFVPQKPFNVKADSEVGAFAFALKLWFIGFISAAEDLLVDCDENFVEKNWGRGLSMSSISTREPGSLNWLINLFTSTEEMTNWISSDTDDNAVVITGIYKGSNALY